LQALCVAIVARPFFTLSPRLIRTVRRPLSLLLMLFLLLTQQATLSHAVSHLAPSAVAAAAVQELSSDTREFAAHDCDLCIAAAQFAATLPASILQAPPAAAAGNVHHAFLARGFEAAPALAFRSRAPPVL